MNTSHATAVLVPFDADEVEVQRVRKAALEAWFDGVDSRHLAPVDAPLVRLVDEAVDKVGDRVVIAQAWHVSGPVRPKP